MTIQELQEQVRALTAAQGWTNTTLEERLGFLRGEVEELADEVLLLAGLDDPAEQAAVRVRLGYEIYDVMWNLCDLAGLAGIDLEAALTAKHAINQHRQWRREPGAAPVGDPQ
jgi:NTP pyrophosphatase (non-canonical NTP hydrolase)